MLLTFDAYYIVVHGPWRVAQGSWPMPQSSWLEAHSSWPRTKISSGRWRLQHRPKCVELILMHFPGLVYAVMGRRRLQNHTKCMEFHKFLGLGNAVVGRRRLQNHSKCMDSMTSWFGQCCGGALAAPETLKMHRNRMHFLDRVMLWWGAGSSSIIANEQNSMQFLVRIMLWWGARGSRIIENV